MAVCEKQLPEDEGQLFSYFDCCSVDGIKDVRRKP
ncbi:hypothetical protein B23_2475 [Geobacillus thermoleovorans B23]|nr:hypothetical protein B23_2475 [Geobacillus thermoleovorans B23]